MLRDENLLFGLYAFRIGLLTKEQLIAISKSLKSGDDVDLGKSLTKRNVLDATQAKALWDLVGVQSAMLGDAASAMGGVPMDDEVRQALHGALIAGAISNPDPGTINLDPPAE